MILEQFAALVQVLHCVDSKCGVNVKVQYPLLEGSEVCLVPRIIDTNTYCDFILILTYSHIIIDLFIFH